MIKSSILVSVINSSSRQTHRWFNTLFTLKNSCHYSHNSRQYGDDQDNLTFTFHSSNPRDHAHTTGTLSAIIIYFQH